MDFTSIPGRLLLDTCVLNTIQDQGEYIFDGYIDGDISEDIIALHKIFRINQRARFQFFVSPLTFAELANATNIYANISRIQWAFEMLGVWLNVLDDTEDRKKDGGTVQHRFKLTKELQELEKQLMEIPDFRRDPFDRLLLIQYKMANCDAFLTQDKNTIWCHKDKLLNEGIKVMSPSDLWNILKPFSALW